MIIDTHCHLEFIKKRFKRDVSLAECMELDGERLGDKFRGAIVNFCQPSEWSCGSGSDEVTSLLRDAADDPRVGITIGCHPHFSDQMTEARWRQLEALTSGSMEKFSWLHVVALGECGLDYTAKNHVSKTTQMEVFARQLNLAMKFNLPLVLHIRDAEADGLRVLDNVGVPSDYPIHRHCFGGDVKAARAWLKKYPCSKIGVTGLVTRHDAKDVRRVIKDVCLDRILLETDAPYHLPEGAANSQFKCSFPGHVIHVAKEVALIKNTSVEDVVRQNYDNTKQIYQKLGKKRKAEDENEEENIKLFIHNLKIRRQELKIIFPEATSTKIINRKNCKNAVIIFKHTREALEAISKEGFKFKKTRRMRPPRR